MLNSRSNESLLLCEKNASIAWLVQHSDDVDKTLFNIEFWVPHARLYQKH